MQKLTSTAKISTKYFRYYDQCSNNNFYLGSTIVALVTVHVVPGHVSIAWSTEHVALTGWEVQPRRLEIGEHPHRRRLGGLGPTKVPMVLISHL